MRLRLITPPTAEPITLSDVEGQCRIGSLSDESASIDVFIQAVREKAEAVTRRQLITAQWELVLDRFPCNRGAIEIPLPPLQSVDSIIYVDPTGAEQTIDPATYRAVVETSPKCQPGSVLPIYGQQWPATLPDSGVVRIAFTAGYGTEPGSVPGGIRNWMLMNIAALYENREVQTVASGRLTEIDLSTLADSLLEDFRIRGW